MRLARDRCVAVPWIFFATRRHSAVEKVVAAAEKVAAVVEKVVAVAGMLLQGLPVPAVPRARATIPR